MSGPRSGTPIAAAVATPKAEIAIDVARVKTLLQWQHPLLLIWFPEQVDDYTFGTWDKGNRINVHTEAASACL